MTREKIARGLAAFVCLCLVSAGQDATEEIGPSHDLIHSDLPIFAAESPDKWPQHTSFDNGSFGCSSRVRFGDWTLRLIEDDGEQQLTWMRIRNYGAFHCFAMVQIASKRGKLAQATVQYSFFVRMRPANGDSPELWALQLGGRPGSDYYLLSRKTLPGLVTEFAVLRSTCPDAAVRKIELDMLSTRYCAINSKDDLLALAERMVGRKPLGTLTFVKGP